MTTKDPKDSVHDEPFDGEKKAIESTEETVNETAASDQPAAKTGTGHDDAIPVAEIKTSEPVAAEEAATDEDAATEDETAIADEATLKEETASKKETASADEDVTEDGASTSEEPVTADAEEAETVEETAIADEALNDEEPAADIKTAGTDEPVSDEEPEIAEEETERAAPDKDVNAEEPGIKETSGAEPVKDTPEDKAAAEKIPEEDARQDKAAAEETPEEDARQDKAAAEETPEEDAPGDVAEIPEEAPGAITETPDEDASGTGSEADQAPEEDSEEERVNYDDIVLPPVDYSGLSRKELLETLILIVDNRPPSEILDDVSRIKELFYKKTKTEFNEKRLEFAKEGGNIDEYKPEPDELENSIKIILETFRSKRTDFNRVQESEKQENLRRKLEIIEQIKELVNREEAINKTFQEFRNLQNEWHSTGIVPQAALKDLWENYHHSVEIFYDYIKINRELRDLDLKKNLEVKIVLCEKAEELLLEPNAVTAFKLLQDYHNNWREIGPVPHENKNDVWERFREATAKVNKRHHEFFENQKDEQKRNLDAKTALCEKAEELASGEILTFADFREKSDAIMECQKLWRTIGFAPKKHNNKIYQRFRTACDKFFEKKRAFFAESKETQVRNLQLKTELCMKAEALQESTDWKDTSEMLIRLQKEWKEIGPVPKKYSEKIWKRFRQACDTFFTHKSEFFQGRDTSYEDNLTAKLAILQEIEAFDAADNQKAAFERLKDIQRRWTEIGYVPFNRKEEVARRYKEALNKQFDKLKLDDEDKNILRYRSKVDSARSDPRAARKVRNEREKFFSKIKQLEGDIVLWENNIGFFAKSANADTMIKEVRDKIEDARKNIKILEEKVKLIDSSMYDE